MSVEAAAVERACWRHDVVEVGGLTLEVDLPGGPDAAGFARLFRTDAGAALRQMLGDWQLEHVIESCRNPATGRISRKAVSETFRGIVAELGELSFLVGALEHEGALRAALRAEYGVDLRDPGMSLLDLADLAANLPPGCALFRAAGGAMAWPPEVHMLAAVEFRLRVLAWQKTEDGKNGRNKPQPIDPPRLASEVEQEQQELSRRAQAYLRRTGQLS